jgi:hypothetical protein
VDTEGARQLLLAERGRLLALRQATARLVDEDVDAAASELSHADHLPCLEDQARLERRRVG